MNERTTLENKQSYEFLSIFIINKTHENDIYLITIKRFLKIIRFETNDFLQKVHRLFQWIDLFPLAFRTILKQNINYEYGLNKMKGQMVLGSKSSL